MAERRNKTTPWERFAGTAGEVDFTSSPEWQMLRREQEEEDRRRIESAGRPNTRGRYRPIQEEEVQDTRPEAQRFGSAVIDSAQGGAQRTAAGFLGQAAGSASRRDLQFSDVDPFNAPTQVAEDLAVASINKLRDISPWYDQAYEGAVGWLNETGGRLMDAAGANSRAVEQQTRDMQLGWVDQGVIDLAGSPSSALSVFGGPAAGITAADVQGQSYVEGRRGGLSHEEARERAEVLSNVELGTSIIPTGKLISKIPGVDKIVNDIVQGNLRKWATRTAAVAAGEGLQESVTTLAQMGVDANIANNESNSQELRDFAKSQLPTDTVDFFHQVRRSAVAGVLGGGSLGQVEVRNSMIADAGKLVADMYTATAQARAAAGQTPAPAPSTTDDLTAAQNQLITSPRQDNEGMFRNVNQPTAEQLRADAERVAGTMPVRQQDLPQDAEDFNRMPIPGVRGYAPYRATPEGAAATAEQATAARPISAIERENARLAAAVTSRQNAITESSAAIEANQRAEAKRLADANKAQNQKFGADRAAARKGFVQEALGMPEAQRVQFVADQLQSWDAANPRPAPLTAVPVDAPKTNTKAAAVTPKTPKPPSDKLRAAYKENFPDLDDAGIDQMIQQDRESAGDLKRRVGLAEDASWTTAETSGPDTQKVTPEMVVAGVAEAIGNKNANIIAKMIGDGKLVINTADNMPINPRVRGAYIGSTGKMHINADRLNADNMLGEVLSIMAHEAKHGGDVGGSNLPTSLGDFIGASVNDDLVRKIEAQAAGGNKLAQEAVAAAKAGHRGSEADVYKMELPAYYIQRARDARSQRGTVARISGDIVSAVRTAWKRNRPGDNVPDINLNDVAYMSDRLNEAVAQADQGFQPSNVGERATIMGARGADFGQREAEGTVYLSADGTRKFVVSDINAKLKPGAGELLLSLQEDEAYKVGDLMDHPELFRNYPEAANIPVTLMAGGKSNAFAQYAAADQETGESGYIEVDPRIIRGERTESDATSLKQSLLHEVQHWIQDQEGQSINFHDESYMDRPAAEQQAIFDFELAKEENDSFIDQIIASKDVREAIKNRAEAVKIVTNPDLPNPQKAYRLLTLALEGNPSDAVIALGQKYNDSRDKYNATVGPKNEAERAAKKRYLDNITEQEAFFTQNNANTPQERLPVNPESRFKEDRGRIAGAGDVTLAADDTASIVERLGSPDINTRAGKAMQLAKAQLLYTSGIGKDVYDRLGMSVGEAAVDAQRGLNAGANIEAGIRKMASRTGKSVDETREEIRKRMDSLAKLPSPEARQRALDALVRANPEMKALNQAYSDISELTKTIVRQMLERNPNPTEADQKFMQELLDNSFGYTTRMYAAYQGEAGSEYSRKLYNDYNKARDKVTKKKKLSKDEQIALKKVDDAVAYLAKTDLTIPDAKNIGKVKIDKIRYLYDQWIGDSTRAEKLAYEAAKRDGVRSNATARANAREKLEQELLNLAPKIDTATIQARAKDAVDTILGVTKTTGSVPQYLRTASADRGILQKRQELPEPIRNLLGEITDPRTRVAATLAKQGELAARTKFLQWLKDNKEGTVVVPGNTPSNGKFTATLEGEGFGPLKGWKTTPQIEAVLNDQLGMFSSLSDALAQGFAGKDAQDYATLRKIDSAVKWGAGAAKVGSVILEGYGTLMNALGAVVIPVANGVYNPKYWLQGAQSSADIIKNEFFNNNGSLREGTQRAIRLGVVDSAKVNELRDSVQRRVRDEITGTGPATSVGRGLKWSKRVAIETFAQADVWPKIAALNERIDMLTAFYKAEGVDKSKEDIEAEAATTIKDSNISTDRVPPAIKAIESRGVTTFLPYFYNVPRSMTMNVAWGMRDFLDAFNAKTPEGKLIKGAAGLKRVGGSAAVTWAMVEGLKAWAAAANGEDDEKVEEMRKVMRPDSRYGAPVYLGEDETGTPLFFRMSRVDPQGPVHDMLRMLMDGETSKEEAAGYAWQYTKDLAFANRFAKIVVDTASTTVGDGKFKDRQVRLERIAPETVSILKEAARTVGIPDKLVESTVSAADTVMPGQIDMFDPENKRVTQPKNDEAKAIGDGVFFLGGRLDRANPTSRAYEVGAKIKESRDRARRLNAEYQSTGRVDAALRQARRSDEEIYDAMQEAVDLYDGMVDGLDYSPKQAADILKTAGFDAKDISLIRSGRLPAELNETKVGQLSRAFSKQSLEQRSKYRETLLSREERARLKRERQDYLRNLEERDAQTE